MRNWVHTVAALTLIHGTVLADDPALKAQLDAVFGHPDFSRAVWACAVTDVETGGVLYERRADEAVIPASNQKLYVAAAAWLRQGPDHRAFTEYWGRGAVRDGVLDGDLILRGYGAFCVSAHFPRSRPVPERERALQAQLDAVVSRLRAAGVGEVRGRVLFDRSRWTDMPSNTHYRAADALLFHDNTLDILVTNGAVRCCPSSLVSFRVEVAAGLGKQQRTLFEGRPTDTLRIDPFASGEDYWRLEAADPCAYYSSQVQAALEQRGLHVTGAQVTAAPDQERLLFRLPGLSLRELLPAMLSHSDNLRAEMVLLNLGYGVYRRANYANGTRAVMEVLGAAGVTHGEYRAADGCGLSIDNRVTCRDTVRLLAMMAVQPDGAVFRSSMAVSGTSGTLEKRLTAEGVKGRVQGKSGTLASVAALSGYAQTGSGRMLCFSFICNRIPDAERCWKGMEEALGLLCRAP
jgi:D-alanyl-D-alanine carboxypeptidase/D-alanyl-D-alanine-endopeptidase (penicillin-binding protein 4)